jgi:hypothetical protein
LSSERASDGFGLICRLGVAITSVVLEMDGKSPARYLRYPP